MTVDLDELSCDQLRVALDALPKPGRSWGASDPRVWQIRRRVREVENAITTRCSPVPEHPEGLGHADGRAPGRSGNASTMARM